MESRSTIIKFANYFKIEEVKWDGGVANTSEGRIRIQNDLEKLERWSEINRLQFCKNKYKKYYI